jgi:hypothetical protein
MLTSGIFKIHKYEIKIQKMGDPIYLHPFGDVHRSSPACDVGRWDEWRNNAKKVINNSYFLGIGDYDDLASTSERELLGNRKFHESTTRTLEDLYESHIQRFHKEIAFMGDHLIGLVGGNHYAEFCDGTTSDVRLAQRMRTTFLGCSAFIRLSFNYHGARSHLDIFVHHGKGAARLNGGSLNRVIQMGEVADADIYLMGHDHKKPAGFTPKLRLEHDAKKGLVLKHKRQLALRTGSFLKGWEPDMASYVVDACMGPADLGAPVIIMTPKRPESGEFFIDLAATI